MEKIIITTENAPSPIGPYNQAIKVGNTLYVSGQIPLIPVSMKLFNGTIIQETEIVMKNLEAILDAAKMSFNDVVKSTIFLSDMEDFAKVNEVYGNYFNNNTAPARETIAVKSLPKFVRIEISMIAVV